MRLVQVQLEQDVQEGRQSSKIDRCCCLYLVSSSYFRIGRSETPVNGNFSTFPRYFCLSQGFFGVLCRRLNCALPRQVRRYSFHHGSQHLQTFLHQIRQDTFLHQSRQDTFLHQSRHGHSAHDEESAKAKVAIRDPRSRASRAMDFDCDCVAKGSLTYLKFDFREISGQRQVRQRMSQRHQVRRREVRRRMSPALMGEGLGRRSLGKAMSSACATLTENSCLLLRCFAAQNFSE